MKRKHAAFNFLYPGMLLTGIHVLMMAFANTNRIFETAIYLSIVLWMVAVFLWVSAVYELKKHGGIKTGKNYMNTTRLVKSGIYRFVKHPQYMAYVLFNLGIIFKIQSAVSITLGVMAIVFLSLGMKEEENDLRKKFNDNL